MDFKRLFFQYNAKYTEEFKDYAPKKMYKKLLKEIKYLLLQSSRVSVEAKEQIRLLEKDLFYKTESLEKNEFPHYILLSTGKKKPHGYSRLIEIQQRKEEDGIRFIDIFLLLKEILIGYHKEYQLKIENLILLEILLKVASSSLFAHQEEYEELIEDAKEKLQKEEMPTLKNISQCEELQIFIQETYIVQFQTEGQYRRKRIIPLKKNL